MWRFNLVFKMASAKYWMGFAYSFAWVTPMFCTCMCLNHLASSVFLQKECYLYLILDGKKGRVSSTWIIILLMWKVGSGRFKMRSFQCQSQQDFSCLCWNDAGHCWSFLGWSPKITKNFAEKKFQQNQNCTLITYVECRMYQKQPQLRKSQCKTLKPTKVLLYWLRIIYIYL